MVGRDTIISLKHIGMVDFDNTIANYTKTVNSKIVNTIEKDAFKDICKSIIDYRYKTSETIDVLMALRTLYEDIVSGWMTDNPHSTKIYQPFKRVNLSTNLIGLTFFFNGFLNVVLDCASYPRHIGWVEEGKRVQILDLRHLLNRVCKLSIKGIPTHLINGIMTGISLHKTLKKEVKEYYEVGDIDAGGIGIVRLPLVSIDNVKNNYSISIQFGKMSLWRNKTIKLEETEDESLIVDSLLVEAIENINTNDQ